MNATQKNIHKTFQMLFKHKKDIERVRIADLFIQDSERSQKFSIILGDLMLDFSKSNLTSDTLSLLIQLAQDANVQKYRDYMFAGKVVNDTEGRAALHVALRAPDSWCVTHFQSMSEVAAGRAAFLDFAERVRSGSELGITGKVFRNIVNIGIGGSHLGVEALVEALAPYHSGPRVWYISNIDHESTNRILAELDPEVTLFIVSSKTFGTQETVANAVIAKNWLLSKIGHQKSSDVIHKHFASVSSNIKECQDFGCSSERIFPIWDWVGGRYSIWSAVGLPVAIAIGAERFKELLQGAFAMDEHFRCAEIAKNIPIILALLGFWYREIMMFPVRAVIPYCQRLKGIVSYLQQLEMESNGKCVTKNGEPLGYEGAGIVFGDIGTNAQHSFFQLLHQGKSVVPIDFLVSSGSNPELFANCLGQSQALMYGQDCSSTQDSAPNCNQRLIPHMSCPGNRPSNTIMCKDFDPYSIGMILAMYEHRTFVQGILWDINSFDQWGVALGKNLASRLLPIIRNLDSTIEIRDLDSSTLGLIQHYRHLRAKDKE